MKTMSENEDMKDALLISRLQKQLGRPVTDDEIKYVLGLEKKGNINEAREKVERLRKKQNDNAYIKRKPMRDACGRIIKETIRDSYGRKLNDVD